jgi:hypothetical protein
MTGNGPWISGGYRKTEYVPQGEVCKTLTRDKGDPVAGTGGSVSLPCRTNEVPPGEQSQERRRQEAHPARIRTETNNDRYQ